MLRRPLLGGRLGAVVLLLVASAGTAVAQTDEQRAAARSLATQGVTAFNEGRYKDAADLLTRAEALVHAPTHLMFCARAYAKLGQLVKARELYLKISREQLPPTAPAAYRDAQATAQREVSAIDPKIGELTIKVEGADAAKDPQVKIDGTLISPVLVGVPQPIDPGEHKIDAMATGFRAQQKVVQLGAAEKATVTLKLEPDPTVARESKGHEEAGNGVVASKGSLQGSGLRNGSHATDTESETVSSGSRVPAYAALGVGAAGLGIGTVFLLKSLGKRSDATDLCNIPPDNRCPLNQRDNIASLDAEADSARTVAVVGFVVGGAAVTTGVLLLVLGKPSDSRKSATRLTPWVGLGSAGLAGEF